MQSFSQKELEDARGIAQTHNQNGNPSAQVVAGLVTALTGKQLEAGGDTGVGPEADALHTEILEGLTREHGGAELPDALFLALGKRIHETDRSQWVELAARMIAVGMRLKAVPDAERAVTQVLSLAAIALGDVPLNGQLCRVLYSPKHG